ncbi:MAG: hypothetical protein ABSF92_03085 [Candidatus Acidiferrales bacterium]
MTHLLGPFKLDSYLLTTISQSPAPQVPSPANPPAARGKHASRKARRSALRRAFFLLFAVFLVFVVVILLDGYFVRLPDGAGVSVPPAERIGIVHVHTTAAHSSVAIRRELHRSANLQRVLDAAGAAKLSYITITDHNYVSHLWPETRVPAGLTPIFGEEVSTTGGHFLAFGLPEGWKPPSPPKPAESLASARAAGATTFLAHPIQHHIPWRDWKTNDFDGIEIWNEDAALHNNNVFDFLVSLVMYGVNPDLAMVRLARTPDKNFAKWDELLRDRPVAGICASDAHGGIWLGDGNGVTLRFPAYAPAFRIARQHLLLPPEYAANPERADAGVLLEALKSGHSYCALDALSPAAGFVQSISSGGAASGPGDSVTWIPGSRLHVSLPHTSGIPRIEVFRDGRKFAEAEDWSLDAPLDGPGRYRTEVFLRPPGLTSWRRWTMWIFSNPTYVLPAATTAAKESSRHAPSSSPESNRVRP